MNFKKTAAMLSAACIVFSSLAGCGGSGNGGSGKAEIKSVSLPEKLDGSVIKILAYDGWEQEHADIRKQLKDWYGASVEYTVVDNKDMKGRSELTGEKDYVTDEIDRFFFFKQKTAYEIGQ